MAREEQTGTAREEQAGEGRIKVKKLEVNKETIKELSNDESKEVKGAKPPPTWTDSCTACCY